MSVLEKFKQEYKVNVNDESLTDVENKDDLLLDKISTEPLMLEDIQFELAQINQLLEGFDIAAADEIKLLIDEIDDADTLKILKRALYLTNEYEFEKAAKKLTELTLS